MSRNTMRICWLGLVIMIAGCNGKSEEAKEEQTTNKSPQTLIAVIDLNVVAHEIGAQDKIDRSVMDKKAELANRMADYEMKLSGEPADQEMAIKRQAQLAQTQLLAHRAQLKQQLLAQIRPVAYLAAQERGMEIVLTAAQVYAAGPNVDITQDVVKRIQIINQSTENGSSAGLEESPVRLAELPAGGGDFQPQ
ncbi:MAG: hypothetical protein GY904_32605 [Planctomycetaceae bacterium]|nr:hypothetical protein [Planctomycetaceae bacterium]